MKKSFNPVSIRSRVARDHEGCGSGAVHPGFNPVSIRSRVASLLQVCSQELLGVSIPYQSGLVLPVNSAVAKAVRFLVFQSRINPVSCCQIEKFVLLKSKKIVSIPYQSGLVLPVPQTSPERWGTTSFNPVSIRSRVARQKYLSPEAASERFNPVSIRSRVASLVLDTDCRSKGRVSIPYQSGLVLPGQSVRRVVSRSVSFNPVSIRSRVASGSSTCSTTPARVGFNPVSIRSRVASFSFKTAPLAEARVSIPYQSGLVLPVAEGEIKTVHISGVSIPYQSGLVLPVIVIVFVPVSAVLFQSRINPVSCCQFQPLIGI